MASRVDLAEIAPLFRMGARLDLTGRAATHGIERAFKNLDPLEIAASVAVAAEEAHPPEEVDPESEEEAETIWDAVLQTLLDWFMEAHLEALDISTEYLTARVTSPVVVDPVPFLGRAGTQSIESFVEATPTVVGRRVAAGMPVEMALEQSKQLLSSMAQSDTHSIGRDAVATVANNDPRFTKYARIAQPGACAWCAMLAGRGAVYTVDTANTTRDGQKYHSPYLNKNGNLVGGFCKCTMEAVAASAHANPARTRPGRAGDKAAIRAAYKSGAQTPERVAMVARKLDILNRHAMAGMATDWTRAKMLALQAEQVGLLGVAFGFGGGRSWRFPEETPQRHLQGQHDQKTHGHGGGGTATLVRPTALPEGWALEEKYGTQTAVLVTGGGKTGVVKVIGKVHTFVGPDPDLRFAEEFSAEEHAAVHDAVVRVAHHVDRLQRANPVGEDLNITISGTELGGNRGGETVWDTFAPEVTINSNVIRDDPARAARWRESIRGHGHAGDPDDVLGTVVTHEYGHVMSRTGALRADPSVQTVLKSGAYTHSIKATEAVVDTPEEFSRLTGYGQTHMSEAYAELFSEWSYRDQRPPSPMAVELARNEGWK